MGSPVRNQLVAKKSSKALNSWPSANGLSSERSDVAQESSKPQKLANWITCPKYEAIELSEILRIQRTIPFLESQGREQIIQLSCLTWGCLYSYELSTPWWIWRRRGAGGSSATAPHGQETICHHPPSKLSKVDRQPSLSIQHTYKVVLNQQLQVRAQ